MIVGGIDVLVDSDSASLEGSSVITLPGIGHHGLIYDPGAWSAVVDAVTSRELRESGTYPTFDEIRTGRVRASGA